MSYEPDKSRTDRVEDSLDDLLRLAQWPDDASDPLDRLLRLAQWPEPGECSLPHVRRIDRQRKRMRILAAIGAAAAVLLTALAIWTARGSGDKPSAGVVNTVASEATPATSAADENPKIAAPPPREVRLRMILEQVRERSAAEDEAIDRLVARRVAEPDGDLEELVQPLLAQRAEIEQRLLGRFNTFVGKREPAAVELLGCLGSEATVPLLLFERLKPATHAVAVRALLKLADTLTLARLERQEWDDDLREEITAALQSREDNQPVASTLFLEGDQSCIELRSDYWPHAALF